MKIIAFITVIVLSIVFILPDSANAGTRATVYIAGGFVVGGVAFFFTIIIGNNRHSEKEKEPEKDNPYPAMYAFKSKSEPSTDDDVSQAGMVKILEW